MSHKKFIWRISANKKIICSFIVILSSTVIKAQTENWRDQYVKWSIGINYNNGLLKNEKEEKKKNFEKFSGIISVDVALSDNDVFDSAVFYLQPYVELSLSVNNPFNDKIKFSTYGGGVNLKSYLNLGNQKNNFFFILGGKLEYVSWRYNYLKAEELKTQRYLNLDYVITGGIGYTITDRFELICYYQKGFSDAYILDFYDKGTKLDQISVGVKIALVKNWWFR